MRIFALILTGGKASRMGKDKSIMLLAQKPMAMWVRDALLGSGEICAVAGLKDHAAALDIALIEEGNDLTPGPLRGICAGLEWAKSHGAQWLLVAPCDVPFLPDNFGALLLDAALSNGRQIAYARGSKGIEPLISIWSSSLCDELRQKLTQTDHPPVRALIEDWDGAGVDFPDDWLVNVNDPIIWRQAVKRLGHDGK